MSKPDSKSGIRARAILLALVIIPVNCLWIVKAELYASAGKPTTIALFFNVILWMVVIGAFNSLIRRLRPGQEFRPAELVAIYSMLCMASAMSGADMIQAVTPILTHHSYLSDSQNRWAEMFRNKLPEALIVTSEKAITNFGAGKSSLYFPENYLPWIRPVLAWIGFFTTLVFTSMCLNVIFLKEWTQNERLSFPIIGLPLALATRPKQLCWNSHFAAGFAIAGGICLLNGLHHLYPDIPGIPVKSRHLNFFIEMGPPWSAIGWFPVSFYSFAIGLSFLMPLDMMFSCWFFFLFWKLESVFISWLGYSHLLSGGCIRHQATGAYLAIAAGAVWIARRHLLDVFRKVMGKESELSDAGQPISYRAASAGALFGFTCVVGFAWWAGLSLHLAIIFFLLYFGIVMGIARMRAVCGPPAHDLTVSGPDEALISTLGPNNMDSNSLGVLSVFYSFNRAYRGHPVAHSLESFKMGQVTRANQRTLFCLQILAVVVACVFAFWVLLHLGYANDSGTGGLWYARRPYRRLAHWLQHPAGASYTSLIFHVFGFVVVMALPMVRMVFPSLPFHALGYAISSSWSMHLVWVPIFIGWCCKLAIIRYSGGKGYRTWMPFFLGLILGDYVIGGGWSLASLITGQR
ncbi:MAG: hypothetical protein QF886_14820, partial [Planctomycetota bacterium]|nr:hypothetical protein [Planctomycetota bacterium]